MDKDWIFTIEEYICDLRAAAVLVKDNKILVQRDKDGNEYALPGGHVKIGETLEAGLIRETMEEMVVYKALYGEGGYWVRPASLWNETVERDAKVFKRFEYIEE